MMGYLGDGATSTGDFHAAANFAGVLKAPVVFFCQTNQLAISVPLSGQTASESIAIKSVAYGFPGVRVDGYVYEGWNVPVEYDALLAKLICWGRDRSEAIARLRRALDADARAQLAQLAEEHPDWTVQLIHRQAQSTLARRLAFVTGVATLLLILAGGLVTNTGAALAVPDWPTTFGYTMFTYPWSAMVGGIFYEHSHRLLGSLVGLLTLALAAALWPAGGRLRALGLVAVAVVVLQGILGGLRVVLVEFRLAVLHGGPGRLRAVAVHHLGRVLAVAQRPVRARQVPRRLQQFEQERGLPPTDVLHQQHTQESKATRSRTRKKK
jgi:hypothetical protein